MIYEWRSYRFAPGKAAAYLAAFQAEGLPLVTRHLPMLGYWLTECGRLNVLHHLWAYRDLEDRTARRLRLAADADWTGGFGPRAFPMIEEQESLFLTPVSGSPRLAAAEAAAGAPLASPPGDAPLLAASWLVLEIAEAAFAPAGEEGADEGGAEGIETVAVWRVAAGARPGGHLRLRRSETAGGVPLAPRPAVLRELMRPAGFSPLR